MSEIRDPNSGGRERKVLIGGIRDPKSGDESETLKFDPRRLGDALYVQWAGHSHTHTHCGGLDWRPLLLGLSPQVSH